MAESVDSIDFNMDVLKPIVDHEVSTAEKFNHFDFHNHKPDLFKTICQHAARKDNFVDWRQTLECCGQKINHIYDGGYYMTNETFSLAQKFCPLLKTINISLAHDNVQYVQSYLPQWSLLEEIELRGPACMKEVLWSLQKLPLLRKLSLWNFEFANSECRYLFLV